MTTFKFKRALLVVFALHTIASCSSPDENKTPPRPMRELVLQIVHGLETAPILNAAKIRFDALKTTLGDGSVVKIALSQVPELEAARKLANGELKVDGWLVGPQALTPFVNSHIKGMGAKQVDCVPLFGSPIVLAARQSDVSIVGAQDGKISWNNFFEKMKTGETTKEGSLKNFLTLSHENPMVSGTGISSLVQLALWSQTPPSSASTTEAFDPWIRLNAYESVFTNYDVESGATRMRSSSRRAGAVPLILTTEQQVIDYNRNLPPGGKGYAALYPQEGSYYQEYQLCTSDAAWVPSAKKMGLRMFTQFLKSDAIARLSAQSGFRSSSVAELSKDFAPASFGVHLAAPSQIAPSSTEDMASTMIAKWPDLAKPAAVVFVLDSSISMAGEAFERSRVQLKRLLSLQPSRDSSALISLSFGAKLEAPLSMDTPASTKALTELTAMGGATILDGIKAAFKILASPSLQGHRKVIVLITAGADSNSSTSIEEISDDLFTEQVTLRVVSITGLLNVTTESTRLIRALSSDGQVDYREINVDAIETGFEELRKRL